MNSVGVTDADRIGSALENITSLFLCYAQIAMHSNIPATVSKKEVV